MYRLVASDMDETFLNDRHRVPEVNKHALERMRELGVLFVPSSGRPYQSIVNTLAELDRSLLEGSYVISYNGGFINRFGDPEPLRSMTIDRPSVEVLYAWGVEHRKAMHVYTASGTAFTQFLPAEEREYLSCFSGIVELDDAVHTLDFADSNLVKIIFMDLDCAACHRIGDELSTLLDPTKVSVTYSSSRYVEFVPAGMDKGAGLKHLAELLGIPIAETIGVGDSTNDLAMIQAAGLGVGVANVTDDVRPYCDIVLETTGAAGAFPELVERVLEPGR